jgi:hypothetical protein
MIRDHAPVVFDKFNGYWNRGDPENTPMDHFSDANNIRYFGANSFGTRYGIGPNQNVPSPLASILRIYNYPTNTGQTLLVLTTGGTIYHIVNPTTIFGPILTIAAMTDFGFVPYAGRAYITPFTTEVLGTMNIERGLVNDYLYVYKGDGSAARRAGGNPPTVPLTVVNSANPGPGDAGVHIFGYVYETDTGYLTAPGGLVAFTTDGVHALDFSNIANSPDSFVVKKHLVASALIPTYNGDVNGYDLFFIPGADIPNNTTTVLNDVSFFDADLLDDATHLLDNFALIPAGVNLCLYHNRLVSVGEHDNISTARVSAVGEPEAISQITGLLEVPADGNPLTNCFELRDVLYLTKRNKTVAYVDNGDDPTTWPLTSIDAAMGTGVHGVATVVDAGSQNIDYAVVGTYKGMAMFNGRYILPELTWKIQTFWLAQDFLHNNRWLQIVNDAVGQNIYMVTTGRQVLYANYANGFDPKSIRWSPWTFNTFVNSLCLNNINDLLLGCDQV